ncbi:MAG: hypothetical protein QF416_04385, partial [Candidatus Marinimicrobia bacterium]|nr:hypothetical protein [Candidatus Neomarinimicrobiota bacterium]
EELSAVLKEERKLVLTEELHRQLIVEVDNFLEENPSINEGIVDKVKKFMKNPRTIALGLALVSLLGAAKPAQAAIGVPDPGVETAYVVDDPHSENPNDKILTSQGVDAVVSNLEDMIRRFPRAQSSVRDAGGYNVTREALQSLRDAVEAEETISVDQLHGLLQTSWNHITRSMDDSVAAGHDVAEVEAYFNELVDAGGQDYLRLVGAAGPGYVGFNQPPPGFQAPASGN